MSSLIVCDTWCNGKPVFILHTGKLYGKEIKGMICQVDGTICQVDGTICQVDGTICQVYATTCHLLSDADPDNCILLHDSTF